MKTLIILFLQLLVSDSLALPASNPEISKLAGSYRGDHFVYYYEGCPEGGARLEYHVLDKNKVVQKNYVLSDTTFDVSAANPFAEQVSEADCRAAIKKMQSELKPAWLKKLKIRIDECAGRRSEVITGS